MRIKLLYALLILLFTNTFTNAQQPSSLQQWKDLKYSMFIHYGIYSVLGGVWDGKPISRGLSEQIQAHAGIYSDTYAAVAKQFNPVHWNADSIALLAKAAGMRSIVITSKHHDGFCMFHSAHTDFNVVEATPFKRDILQELSEACKRHGLKFGLYFSLIDWHYPQASPISSHNSDYITPEHHVYNKKQVTELMTNYGPVSELWFDMGSQSAEQSKELRDLVHRLQPGCLVSSRIGNDMGDFTVMGDNQEPDYSIGVPWQSPASFFDETWGYRSWQKRGSEQEKANEKLISLIRVVSRGGNYLLNIGPKGDGSVVGFEKDVLLRIGNWLAKNQDAIYGAQPDPFHVPFDWGSITSRKNKLYLHVMKAPQNGIIILPGLKGAVKKASVLDGGNNVTFSSNAQGITIQLPKSITGKQNVSVIVVEFKDSYTITPVNTIAERNHKFSLTHQNSFKYYSNSTIDYNTRFRSTVKESWVIAAKQKGTYAPQIFYTAEEKGRDITLTLDAKEHSIRLDNDEAVKLENDPSTLAWGPQYLAGPFWSEFEGTQGDISNIDISKPWGGQHDSPWRLQANRKAGDPYSLPAELNTAYYVLQEITSPTDQPLLVGITSGDGVVVFVNGEEQLIHLNPNQKGSIHDVVLVRLRKGKNQLLVKFFNNFQKNIIGSFYPSVQQVFYKKTLEPVAFQTGKLYPVMMRLTNPVTPHQDMLVPNLSVEFVLK
jgi:alpha-L-fucosidase